MKAKQSEKVEYGVGKTVDLSFELTVERTHEALKQEGFGVLYEIRLDEKLKEKLGIDFRRYVILGACNPPLAYIALQEDINLGLLLPCNVIVYETDDNSRSVVAAVDAQAMLSIVGDRAGLDEVSKEVDERLRRVIDSI